MKIIIYLKLKFRITPLYFLFLFQNMNSQDTKLKKSLKAESLTHYNELRNSSIRQIKFIFELLTKHTLREITLV